MFCSHAQSSASATWCARPVAVSAKPITVLSRNPSAGGPASSAAAASTSNSAARAAPARGSPATASPSATPASRQLAAGTGMCLPSTLETSRNERVPAARSPTASRSRAAASSTGAAVMAAAARKA